jgi:hypothetical protein
MGCMALARALRDVPWAEALLKFLDYATTAQNTHCAKSLCTIELVHLKTHPALHLPWHPHHRALAPTPNTSQQIAASNESMHFMTRHLHCPDGLFLFSRQQKSADSIHKMR